MAGLFRGIEGGGPAARAASALAGVGLFLGAGRAALIRLETPSADATRALFDDPATGQVLVDLDDAADDATRADALARLDRALAPSTRLASLGVALSDPAELYRIAVPAAELDDVLALRGEGPFEEVEVEHTWSIPESSADVRLVPSTETTPAPLDGEGFRPNDPFYRHQWHLDQIGMPNAWQVSRGEGVVVAVIDTGVAYRDAEGVARAPDLADTEFVPGYDFVDRDTEPDDGHGHGTHVAGTIAQSTNNGVGVAGVAPRARIMPLRVLDSNGSGSWGGISAAIRFAADHGAHVINMSLGGGLPSRTVARAIDYAHEKGVVIIAAAGNAGRAPVEYPARHRHVIAVGSVRFDRTRSFFSSFGDGLDIMAPGGDLRVDQNGDGLPDGVFQNTIVGRDRRRFDYLAWQGTSMAAPHVAGVAALVRAGGVTDPDVIERVLTESADGLGNRADFGAGLVRADRAVSRPREETPLSGAGGLAAALLVAIVTPTRRRGVTTPLDRVVSLAGAGVVGALTSVLLGLVGATGGLVGTLALGAALAAFFATVLVVLQLERARPWLIAGGAGLAGAAAIEALFPLHIGGGPLIGLALTAVAVATVGLTRQVARA